MTWTGEGPVGGEQSDRECPEARFSALLEDSVEDLYRTASHIKPGRTVKLKLRREGQDKVIDLTPPAGL